MVTLHERADMPQDVLDQLAATKVPAPPAWPTFNSRLHRQINNRLLISQLFDLALGGTAYALMHFVEALWGLVTLTLFGRFEQAPRRRDKRDPDR